MVRFFATSSSPLVKVMVPATLKLIVSPGGALAIASRNEPGPLSARLLTVPASACRAVVPTTIAANSAGSPILNQLPGCFFVSFALCVFILSVLLVWFALVVSDRQQSLLLLVCPWLKAAAALTHAALFSSL